MQCESYLNTTRSAEMGGEEGAVGLHVIPPQVVLGVAIDDDVPCSLKHQLSPISLLFFFFLTPYFLFSFASFAPQYTGQSGFNRRDPSRDPRARVMILLVVVFAF
ncbi:hypothetical protein I7I53_12199 [Histoplasma capsulatum var. duboisii H88]|uniref:Uncharacterized protein n=1 Tax=Ajellomyces capsulatus (strain H88) TaxID=544711 RepID=A0A8A1LXD8_AJEC8|nr:hypothetical protein I7I53_12199 [Histoplasma capsulatum var. duboisii H88]